VIDCRDNEQGGEARARRPRAAPLERVPAEWIPIRVKKTRQNKNLASVLIQSEPIML